MNVGEVRELGQAIRGEIGLLWRTRPLRRTRRYVRDEIETALTTMRDVFLPVIPALHARWSRVLGAPAPAFLKLGNWIGGDRDGNPNVDADTLRHALRGQAEAAIGFHLDRVHDLGASLSISTELASVTPEVAALAAGSARERTLVI